VDGLLHLGSSTPRLSRDPELLVKEACPAPGKPGTPGRRVGDSLSDRMSRIDPE